MEDFDIDRMWQYLLAGGLSSVASLGAHLRTGGELTKRAFWTAVLNSGLLGVAIGAVLIWKVGYNHLPLIIAVSILAGLGGMSFVDFILGMARLAVKRQVKHYVGTKARDDDKEHDGR